MPATGSGRSERVSSGGGVFPTWRRDGRELFYLAAGGQLMAADVGPGDPSDVSAPRALFTSCVSDLPMYYQYPFSVLADGSRSLWICAVPQTAPAAISVLIDWTAQLERAAPR